MSITTTGRGRRRPLASRLSSAWFLRASAFLIALTLTCASAARAESGGAVRIGVLANQGPEECQARWNPTAEYLSRRIPDQAFAIVPLGFDEIESAASSGAVDFVLANPSVYVSLEIGAGASRIVTLSSSRMGRATSGFGGVILCRADREDIQELSDLRGKSFAAVAENSLGGWHAASRELTRAGVDPRRDLRELVFTGAHDAAVLAVRDGVVDAGTARTDALEHMATRGEIALEDFRVLNPQPRSDDAPFLRSTDLYPEWPLAKLRHVDDQLSKAVASALLTMSMDDPAARAAGIAGWTTPRNYQVVHDCLRELRLPPYESLGEVSWVQALRKAWPAAVGVAFIALLSALYAGRIRVLNHRLRETLASRDAQHDALLASRSELETMIRSLPLGIVVVDEESLVITDVNPCALDLIGKPAEEVIGQRCKSLVCAPSAGDGCPVLRAGQPIEREETSIQGAGSEPTPVLRSVLRATLNERPVLLGCFVNIAEQKAAQRALEDLSHLDGLTGIANRRSLDAQLADEWARATRTRQPLAVALCDVDHFKSFNDVFGHQAGDECLKRIASLLASTCRRAGEHCARWGGEEFCVLLPGAQAADARAMGERLRRAVEEAHLMRDAEHGGVVTISVGVAVMTPEVGDDRAALVGAADEALYTSKAEGRNRTTVTDLSAQVPHESAMR